jgi:hypothetical protein
MAEGLKAVMESSPEVRDYFVFDTVVTAVASPIAERLWDRGECRAPSIKVLKLDQEPPGDLIMTIRF